MQKRRIQTGNIIAVENQRNQGPTESICWTTQTSGAINKSIIFVDGCRENASRWKWLHWRTGIGPGFWLEKRVNFENRAIDSRVEWPVSGTECNGHFTGIFVG